MNVSPEALVDQLASTQAGCVSRSQALTIGLSDATIRRRLKTRRWHRAHPGVYVLVGASRSWMQDVWTAVLAAGPRSVPSQDVAVTHESALLLHGLAPTRVRRYPITLTVPNGCHPRVPGAVVHQIDDLEPHHCTNLGALTVATPARAIVDLAANVGKVHLGSLVDELVVQRRVTPAALSACLADVARPGKPGVNTMGSVLDDRGPGHVPAQSDLERLLFQAIATAGLPEPVRQFMLPGRHARPEFVDAAYLDALLIVEADGRRWHTRIQDLKRDHARDAEASRSGWLTLRFVCEELTAAPEEVGATISAVRATRLAQLNHVGV